MQRFARQLSAGVGVLLSAAVLATSVATASHAGSIGGWFGGDTGGNPSIADPARDAQPAPRPLGAAANAAPTMNAIFNVPGDNGSLDNSIEKKLSDLADLAPAGSTIRVSIFTWSSPTFPQALARAKARGVHVHVVADKSGEGVNTRPGNKAIATLKGAHLDTLHWCGTKAGTTAGSTACIGNRSGSINHTKFALFSQTDGSSNVAVITSQNMTYSQNNLFNNAVVVRSDTALYNAMVTYFNDLAAERKNNNYFDSTHGYFRSPQTGNTIYISPRATSSGGGGEEAKTDTIRQSLKHLAYEKGCFVDTVQWYITDARTAVADELLRIAKAGCKVRVVYMRMSDGAYKILRQSGNIKLKRYYDNETSNIDGRVVGVHSKYLVMKGKYGDKGGRAIVFTGSHNVTGAALRDNDEIYFKLENSWITSQFRGNFNTIWQRAKCVRPQGNSCGAS